MGRLDLLKRLLGGGERPRGGPTDGGLYIEIRCDACGEVVRARISPTSELSQSDDGNSYFVRKVLVGQRCFRPIEVELTYADLRGTEINRQVRGGTSIS
ncbi:MAG: hypothetical protein M3336_05930 [Chloroflexota bacterium]|nr:hypothetical protein [Chloroflexota bacterium]